MRPRTGVVLKTRLS